MKKSVLLPFITFFFISSQIVYSAPFTFEDAQNVFQTRGPDAVGVQNALKAAEMFETLSKEAGNELDKAKMMVAQSKAMYYYAEHTTDNDVKIAGHLKGKELGKQAAALLHENGNPTKVKHSSYSPTLAQAYYWLGANMGKWGLANGILNSLRQWPELRETMGYLEKIGQKEAEYYGANRILAWAYFKLPFPLGDSNKALELMEEAFEQTLDEVTYELSSHGTNVLYYAQILAAKGKKQKAKEILTTFISLEDNEENLRAYNEERLPETKEEIQEAKKILQSL